MARKNKPEYISEYRHQGVVEQWNTQAWITAKPIQCIKRWITLILNYKSDSETHATQSLQTVSSAERSSVLHGISCIYAFPIICDVSATSHSSKEGSGVVFSFGGPQGEGCRDGKAQGTKPRVAAQSVPWMALRGMEGTARAGHMCSWCSPRAGEALAGTTWTGRTH